MNKYVVIMSMPIFSLGRVLLESRFDTIAEKTWLDLLMPCSNVNKIVGKVWNFVFGRSYLYHISFESGTTGKLVHFPF